MKNGNWVPLDKALVHFLPKDRPYTTLEAMYCLSVDVDNGNEGSINGYASLWGWSRNKVRRFLECKRTGSGQVKDRRRTGKGQAVRFINNKLQTEKDSIGTVKGQEKDRGRTPTIYPNPNPNPEPKDTLHENDDIREIIGFLNGAVKTSFRDSSKKTQALIKARIKEGFSVDNFKTVIKKKSAEWILDPDMCKFLRPETLFGTKFESYLNQREVDMRGTSKTRGNYTLADKLREEGKL